LGDIMTEEIIIACVGLVIIGSSLWMTWRSRTKTTAQKVQETAEDLEAALQLAKNLRKKR